MHPRSYQADSEKVENDVRVTHGTDGQLGNCTSHIWQRTTNYSWKSPPRQSQKHLRQQAKTGVCKSLLVTVKPIRIGPTVLKRCEQISSVRLFLFPWEEKQMRHTQMHFWSLQDNSQVRHIFALSPVSWHCDTRVCSHSSHTHVGIAVDCQATKFVTQIYPLQSIDGKFLPCYPVLCRPMSEVIYWE